MLRSYNVVIPVAGENWVHASTGRKVKVRGRGTRYIAVTFIDNGLETLIPARDFTSQYVKEEVVVALNTEPADPNRRPSLEELEKEFLGDDS